MFISVLTVVGLIYYSRHLRNLGPRRLRFAIRSLFLLATALFVHMAVFGILPNLLGLAFFHALAASPIFQGTYFLLILAIASNLSAIVILLLLELGKKPLW